MNAFNLAICGMKPKDEACEVSRESRIWEQVNIDIGHTCMDTSVVRLAIYDRDVAVSCINDSEDYGRGSMAGAGGRLTVLALVLKSDHHARCEFGGLLDDLSVVIGLFCLGNCRFYKGQRV